jgi:hypothetical protein
MDAKIDKNGTARHISATLHLHLHFSTVFCSGFLPFLSIFASMAKIDKNGKNPLQKTVEK